MATDESVLIVDYKTTRPPPAAALELPQAHVAQMALYRALLKPVYPRHEVGAALVYTELPVLIRLEGAAMDDALARLGAA